MITYQLISTSWLLQDTVIFYQIIKSKNSRKLTNFKKTRDSLYLLHLYAAICKVAKIMNSKIVTLAIAVLSLAVVATTANLSTMVYAEKQEDPNCFGEESSELGKSGQMGDHSEEGSSAGEALHFN
jgi:hypothetical protein